MARKLKIYVSHDGTTYFAVATTSRQAAIEAFFLRARRRITMNYLRDMGSTWDIGQVAGTDPIANDPGAVFKAPINGLGRDQWIKIG